MPPDDKELLVEFEDIKLELVKAENVGDIEKQQELLRSYDSLRNRVALLILSA